MTRETKTPGTVLLAISVYFNLCLFTVGNDEETCQPGQAEQETAAKTFRPERLEVAGIDNFYRLSPRLYSGAQPEGSEAFASLQTLGIKTVVTVDGAIPAIEQARHYGMRYVHLPVGYDGIDRAQALKLIKMIQTQPGPVFVHCHHGKHRGPTAAAICGMASEGWSREQATAWLKQAGTAPEYRGLFATVKGFVLPSAEELEAVPAVFPERANLPALVETMVQIDERWDHIKASQRAGFQAPPEHPDIDPPHEALQLAEHFRELLRLPETKAKGEEFVSQMQAMERQATTFVRTLNECRNRPTPESKQAAERQFQRIAASCTRCHARYRDN